MVKFAYPDEKDKNLVEFPKTGVTDEPDMRNLSIYNFNYQYTGEPAIAPIKVFDNGEFTYFQFSKRNAEIPAIFTVDASGYESLINFRSAGEYIIVERVSPQYTLRSGTDIVCVYNSNLYINGKSKSSSAPMSSYNRVGLESPMIPAGVPYGGAPGGSPVLAQPSSPFPPIGDPAFIKRQ